MFSHYMLLITDIMHPHLSKIKGMERYRWYNQLSGVVQIKNNKWSWDARCIEDYIDWNNNEWLSPNNYRDTGTLPFFETWPNNSLIFKWLI